ncbi:MAG: hypothetical protein ACLFT3_11560 [Cyclobacteriaceae bacterium]
MQGWNILSSNEEMAEMVIERASEYGVNHLQLSHQVIMDLRHAKNSKRAAMVNRLTQKAHGAGIDEVLVWDHALYTLDYYPAAFRSGPDSLINLDNPEFWRWIKNDYRQMLSLLPEIDGVVLTFIETGAHVEDQYSEILKTEEEKLAAMVDSLASVIIDEKGLQLYVRTFTYNHAELTSMMKCLELIKNEKIRVMEKEVPHDFFLTHPVAKHVKDIRFPTIIEFDAAHEYNGQGIIASIFPELHLQRWNYYKQFPNVIGYVARTDRFNNTSILHQNPAELNLFALNQGFAQDVSPDSLYQEFVQKYYGQEAIDQLVPAFRMSHSIIQSVFYTLGLNTNSHSRLQYDDNSAYQRHVSAKWMEEPVIKLENGIDKEFHYWKDIVNHLAPAWYKKSEGTQLARESPWVIEKGWLEPVELMDETYLRYVLEEKNYGVKQSEEALKLVQEAKTFVIDQENYDSLLHIYERTLFTSELYEATAKLYFGYRVYTRGPEFRTDYVKQALKEGMIDAKRIAEEMLQYPHTGPIGQFEWQEDAYRALAYYNAVTNRATDEYTPDTFPSFPYQGLSQQEREKIRTEAVKNEIFDF